MEFCHKDVNACQIEVTKMNISIRDRLQPGAEVCRLGIAGNEQELMDAQFRLKQFSLLTNLSEVFHILDSYDNNILRNYECFPVRYKQETTFLRIYHKWSAV